MKKKLINEKKFIEEMLRISKIPGRAPIKPSKRHKDKKKYNRKAKNEQCN